MIREALFMVAAATMIGTPDASSCFVDKTDGSLKVLPTKTQSGLVGEFQLMFSPSNGDKWLHMHQNENEHYHVKVRNKKRSYRADWSVFYAGKQTYNVSSKRKNGDDHYCRLKYEACNHLENDNVDKCKDRGGCYVGALEDCKYQADLSCEKEEADWCVSHDPENGHCDFDFSSWLSPKTKKCDEDEEECNKACEAKRSDECEELRLACDGASVEFHTMKVLNLQFQKYIGMTDNRAVSHGIRRFLGADPSSPSDYHTLVYEDIYFEDQHSITSDGVLRPGAVPVINTCGEVYVGIHIEPAIAWDPGTIYWISEYIVGSDIVSTKFTDERQIMTIFWRQDAAGFLNQLLQ